MCVDRLFQASLLTLYINSGIVPDVWSDTPSPGDSEGSPKRWTRFTRWLKPGLGVKRWMGLGVIGTALIGLGVAVLLLDYYRNHPESNLLAMLSMRNLPRWLRAAVLSLSGIGLLVVAVYKMNQALLEPYVRPGRSIVDAVAQHRRLGRGPKIVAIGGGTGLSTLLRGLKAYSGNLSAIVTVADDGGSSGRLRRSLGLPPPGDVRSCLAALSDDEDLLTQLFQYRFLQGEELGGHSFGNLFIAALAGVTGSFEKGVVEAGRVLGIQGRVLPSTLSDVALVAEKISTREAVRVEGESQIPSVPGRIQHIQLKPADPPAYPDTIQALLGADMIVIGPGSLFTSILPNLLVRDIAQALRASRAFRVFVCNIGSQPGETDGFTCQDHIDALEQHVGQGLVDLVVINDSVPLDLPDHVEAVTPSGEAHLSLPMYAADVADLDHPGRHDHTKLADVLIALLEERTGPLELEQRIGHNNDGGN
jgi:uncharacterized cofD-like protein